MLFLGRSWRSRGGLYSIIRIVHLRQDAGCACENGPLKHCLKKTEHGVASRLAASHARRGADLGVELRDIGVLDSQRVELRRQLHEVFPVGAENALPARNQARGLAERQLADIAR